MELILSKYIVPGNRLQLQQIVRHKSDGNSVQKTYDSQVIDILSDDRIEISMPFEKTKLVLLPVDGEYNLFFYTSNGLYQCSARVIDRYKNSNVFSVLMDLTSNLRKYQRREYYRFSCALEMNSRTLQEEEIETMDEGADALVPELPLQRSVIVDISGGGLRFVANYKYEAESLILCKYNLWVNGESKEFSLFGKVLSVKQVENRPGIYEHRVQYVNMDNDNREEIIKYIFDAERVALQKQKNKRDD
ncbi:MAG: flagellar brake protein [Blautia sp.]|nr:flagellar brake protein [Lachnoclostridium sp.]MCM1210984.1 flagellar brake protein [Blautia sp.]